MVLLGATNARAAYGQVGLWDAEQSQYPALAGAVAAATDRAIAVAVPGGKVEPATRVEVWSATAPDDPTLRPVWSGRITVGERGARIGNWMAGDASEIPAPAGMHRAAVFATTDFAVPPTVRFILQPSG